MGSFDEFLFGTPPSAKGVSTITGPQRQLLTDVSKLQQEGLKSIPEALFPGFPTYELAGIPDFPGITEGQQFSLDQLEAFSKGLPELFRGLQGQTGDIASSIAPLLEGGFNKESFNAFFDEGIRAPLLESLKEDILPEISGPLGENFFGSEFSNNAKDAVDEMIEDLVRERAKLGFIAEESSKDRALKAAELSSGLVNQQAALADKYTDLLNKVVAGEDISRQISAQERNALIEEFMFGINEVAKRLGLAQSTSTAQTIQGIGLPGQDGVADDLIAAAGLTLAAIV